MPPPGAKGPAYIALPNECGPSDQTDLNRMVFFNPLGRWSIIRETGADWPPGQGRAGALGGRAGALPPGPLGLPFILVASGVFYMIENCRTR